MEKLEDIIKRQHRDRAPHDDPLTDRLMAEIVRLAEEVCVLRDRLETCQHLAASGNAADVAAIDAFEPSAEQIQQRLARHREYFEELFERLG